MNEPTTLRESLRLIGEISLDTVHPDVVSLLVWLSYDPESTNEDLESHAKMSPSARKRAIKWLRETKAVEFQYVYQVGDSLIISFEPPNSDAAPGGKPVGRKAKLNWVIINHLDEVNEATLDPLTEGKASELMGPPRTHSVGPPWTPGKEGIGTGEKEKTGCKILPQIYSRDSNRVHPQILVLARRAMNDLTLAAQRNMEIKHPLDLVSSELSNKRLRLFIKAMPERSRWTAWERTVNLFSFWVANHSRKNLKFEVAAFIADHDVWMPSLVQWENSTLEQMRSIASVVVESEDDPQQDADEASKIREEVARVQRDCLQLYKKCPKVKDIERFVSQFESDAVTTVVADQVRPIKDFKERVRAMLAFFKDGAGLKIVESRVNQQRWEDWETFTEGLNNATSLRELLDFCSEWAPDTSGKMDSPPIPPSGTSETAEELFAIALERLKGTSAVRPGASTPVEDS